MHSKQSKWLQDTLSRDLLKRYVNSSDTTLWTTLVVIATKEMLIIVKMLRVELQK